MVKNLKWRNTKEKLAECGRYTVEELFCCSYAPYFWQAIQIRYPEYTQENKELYAFYLNQAVLCYNKGVFLKRNIGFQKSLLKFITG